MKIETINIEFLGHSGFLITYYFQNQLRKIVIDPYNVSDNLKSVDLILITHSHYDHCSIKDIMKIVKKGTKIFISADAQSKINKIKDVEMQIVEPGDVFQIDNLKIEAFPSYNINKKFHERSEGWVGYLIKFENLVIYHAGDTDKIPEMSKLSGYGNHKNNFIALLPVSGVYVMNAEEAAETAALINADLAIPMHYGAGVAGSIEDAKKFLALCESKGIKARILERFS